MTNILFATDRQEEHLDEAARLTGVRAFHADAVAIACYEDVGSLRTLVAIAVFHGDRARAIQMKIAIPVGGSGLTEATAKGLAAAAFHTGYLNKRLIEAWVAADDRASQIALLQAGFGFAALVPGFSKGDRDEAVLVLDIHTFRELEAANAAG